MTKEQFDATEWRKGMKVIYRGKEYEVLGVDFTSREVCLYNDFVCLYNDFEWAMCEPITLIKPNE